MESPLLDLFFPRFCLGCGYVGSYVCPSCEAKIKRVNETRCFYCGRPSLLGFTHPGCWRKRGVDGYLSLYTYGGLFKKLLQTSKYKGSHLVFKSLLAYPQHALLQTLLQWNNLFGVAIVCVPLHPQRMRERGFNQSDLIADRYFNNPCFVKKNLLKRVINTEHLANLKNERERKRHIRGAFAFIGEKAPSAALLVDDVITSGSTILECSKVLKENGVQTVLAFSLAKG